MKPLFGGFLRCTARCRMPMDGGFLRCTARWRIPMDGGFFNGGCRWLAGGFYAELFLWGLF